MQFLTLRVGPNERYGPDGHFNPPTGPPSMGGVSVEANGLGFSHLTTP